jgi:outer membrane immunogenic protein
MSKRTSIGVAVATAVALAASPLAAQQLTGSNKWEGFYAGLNAGGLWQTTAATIGENNTVGGFSGQGGGFAGGAQAGYNYLVGPVLIGGEIDFQGSTLTQSITGGAGPSFISATSAIPWFATFRGRAGYTLGSFMPYVTGGGVWGHQSLSGTDSVGGPFSASNNFWTWTVGGGVEGRINDQWSAKLEYLYMGTPDTPLSTPATTSISEHSVGNLVRVGLNYRFW